VCMLSNISRLSSLVRSLVATLFFDNFSFSLPFPDDFARVREVELCL
jgi:hypothetical protein